MHERLTGCRRAQGAVLHSLWSQLHFGNQELCGHERQQRKWLGRSRRLPVCVISLWQCAKCHELYHVELRQITGQRSQPCASKVACYTMTVSEAGEQPAFDGVGYAYRSALFGKGSWSTMAALVEQPRTPIVYRQAARLRHAIRSTPAVIPCQSMHESNQHSTNTWCSGAKYLQLDARDGPTADSLKGGGLPHVPGHLIIWGLQANRIRLNGQRSACVNGLCAGAARLKEALEAEGLKGGGTVTQRAQRLMLLKDTPRDQLDRKHFAKGIIPQVGAFRTRILARVPDRFQAVLLTSFQTIADILVP